MMSAEAVRWIEESPDSPGRIDLCRIVERSIWGDGSGLQSEYAAGGECYLRGAMFDLLPIYDYRRLCTLDQDDSRNEDNPE